MTRLAVWLDRDHAGWLTHDDSNDGFALAYEPRWASALQSFPISPRLPLPPEREDGGESQSAEVRSFLGNLLPEGEALEQAARINHVSKANLVGLMIALGRETTGAIRVTPERSQRDKAGGAMASGVDAHDDSDRPSRLVTPQELSERIGKRSELPFSVWDGKVHLSISGYQDKIAVYERQGKWYLVDGPRLASTVIVKPMPAPRQLAEVPGNEYMCMQLSKRCGLPTAATRLLHIPEPILLVTRFDRVDEGDRVRRLHLIDGCQALGLPVAKRLERADADAHESHDPRDGVGYQKLFALCDQSPQPMIDRQALLRWAIFQVLIGNTDAHGKNVSFFLGSDGLRLAPAYDLLCMPALHTDRISDSYAMGIGDAFAEGELNASQWDAFAHRCGLPRRMVACQIQQLCRRAIDSLPALADHACAAGVSQAVTRSVAEVVQKNCARQDALASELIKMNGD